MARRWVQNLALLAGVLSVWVGGVVALNATVFSAEDHVASFLDAVAEGDPQQVAAFAGEGEGVHALNSAEISAVEIVAHQTRGPQTAEVLARYFLDGEEATGVFVVERAPRILGVFDRWRFSPPPHSLVTVDIDGHPRAVLGGAVVGDGDSIELLAPGRYRIQGDSRWVEFSLAAVVVSGPSEPRTLKLRALATPALVEEVDQAVAEYLDECVSRDVLQPSSCPFGLTVVDRVAGAPAWEIIRSPRLTIKPTDTPGQWSVVGEGGAAAVGVDVQSIFDGSIERVTDTQEFSVHGIVTGIDSTNPALRLN